MAGMQKPEPLASKAILAMQQDFKDTTDEQRLKDVPPDLVTREAGQSWLRNNFNGPTLTKMLSAYEKRFQEATIAQLEDLEVSLKTVKSDLDQARLEIIPQPIPTWDSYQGDKRTLHLVGILITGLFLSLGAPFWFNALRQLANLRPVLAGKVEKETTEQTKKGNTS